MLIGSEFYKEHSHIQDNHMFVLNSRFEKREKILYINQFFSFLFYLIRFITKITKNLHHFFPKIGRKQKLVPTPIKHRQKSIENINVKAIKIDKITIAMI